MNIMIDTCSWIDLIKEEKDGISLRALNEWEEYGFIILLTNEVIIEEWNRKKKKTYEEILNTLKGKYKNFKEIAKLEGMDITKPLSPNVDEYKIRISRIDNLLNKAKILEIDNNIKSYSYDRIGLKKAPFHSSNDNRNDALIIFSLLDFCKRNNIKNPCFISSNIRDFTDKKVDSNKLHPQLLEDYPEISPSYYQHIRQFIDAHKSQFPLPMESNMHSVIVQLREEISEYNSIDQQIDILYNKLKSMYSHVKFIPLAIIKNIIPLKLKNSYYSRYSLTTDNQQLFDFLKKYRNKSSKVYLDCENKSILDKVSYTIKQLNKNLILFLTSNKTFETLDITVPETENKDLLEESFSSFDFVNILQIISKSSNSFDDKITSAFYFYRLGFFLEAEKMYKEASEIAAENKKHIHLFITRFSRKELINHIRNNYRNNEKASQAVLELEKLDLNEDLKPYNSDFDKNVIDSIRNLDFLNSCRRDLLQTRDQIRDHFYLIESGGWSSGNHYWRLINHFSQFLFFIEKNRIVFELFLEFDEIIDIFTESIICLQAMPETEYGDDKHGLDDWSLNIILHYAKADRIEKYLYRYNLSKLNYLKPENEKIGFHERILNFLSGYESTKKSIEKVSEFENRFFWDKYNQYFQNLLQMASVLKLSQNQIRSINNGIYQFLMQENVIKPYNIEKYVASFLKRQADYLTPPNLKKYLVFFSKKTKYHDTFLLMDICRIIKKKCGKIKLTNTDFNRLLTIGLKECIDCKKRHAKDYLVYLYIILDNETQKDKIKKGISGILEKEYDFNLHYSAIIHDILKLDDNLIERITSIGENIMSDTDLKSTFLKGSDKRYRQLNMLANICFKFNIDLSHSRFDKIRKVNLYYEWLFGIDSFDYKLFNPMWILEYETRYYYKEFQKHCIIKEMICKYFQKSRNTRLEKAFVNIYGCKWDN